MTRQDFNKHKEVIEAWANGADVEWYKFYTDEWVFDKNPSFNSYYKYRIKEQKFTYPMWTQVEEPKQLKTVYEWICKGSTSNAKYPKIHNQLLTEDEAKERFGWNFAWYKKTGRSFEVEA